MYKNVHFTEFQFWGEIIRFTIILYGKWNSFLNQPPPLDTGIADYRDFIFIKEVHTTNGDLYLGGGGNVIHDFWYLGRGNEGDKILTCYTFDLFTLSVNIH